MRVAGRVATVHDGMARIECAPGPSGCGACDSGRGCSWRRLGGRHLDVAGQVDGHPLRPGDTVSLTIDESELQRAVTRIYLPPVAGLLLGAGLGQAVGTGSDAVALLAALVGLTAGHLAARRLARSVRAAVGIERAPGTA